MTFRCGDDARDDRDDLRIGDVVEIQIRGRVATGKVTSCWQDKNTHAAMCCVIVPGVGEVTVYGIQLRLVSPAPPPWEPYVGERVECPAYSDGSLRLGVVTGRWSGSHESFFKVLDLHDKIERTFELADLRQHVLF